METIRPRPNVDLRTEGEIQTDGASSKLDGRNERDQDRPESDSLPPPPEPFPLHQLAGPSTTNGSEIGSARESEAESGDSLVSVKARQDSNTNVNVRGYLFSVQQSCIDALSSLLPASASTPTLTHNHDHNSDPNTLGDDTQLAAALTDLLEVTYSLDDLLPPTPNHITPSASPFTAQSSTFEPSDPHTGNHAVNHTVTRAHEGEEEVRASFEVLAELLGVLQGARTSTSTGAVKEGQSSKFTNENLSGPAPAGQLHPAINIVREELAWARLDSLTTAVLQLSRERSDRAANEQATRDQLARQEDSESPSKQIRVVEGLPPSYAEHESGLGNGDMNSAVQTRTRDASDNTSLLPSYHDLSHPAQSGLHITTQSTEGSKGRETHQTSQGGVSGSPVSRTKAQDGSHVSPQREKMLLELEAVTTAIERLASVAPRLHDQRVELRPSQSSKLARLLGGGDEASANANAIRAGELEGKGKMTKEDKVRLERIKMRELEEIWDKIERAHGKRRIMVEDGQRADGAGWERRRRERFINKLVDKSEMSRMEDQDSPMGSVNAELARARDLRDRDHFLRDLINQSEERRLSDQDANENTIESRQEKQEAFVSDVVSRTRATRLVAQDFPSTVEDRLAERRASYIESLMDYSGSGRLRDQDSLPPTPRTGINGEKEVDPFEVVKVQDFLASTGPPSATSLASRPPTASEEERTSSMSADLMMRTNGRSGSGSGESMVMARSRSDSVPLDDTLIKKSGSASGSTTPTTFKKIAGMMRRGSGHLGLKATGGLDTNNIAYIAEHQENLRSVLVTLHGVGVSPYAELQIEVLSASGASGGQSSSSAEGSQEALITSKKDPNISLKIEIPVPVTSGQIVPFTAQPQQIHLEAKLAAVPTPPSAVSLLPAYALSASDLKSYQAINICCTVCERELATLPRKRKGTRPETGSSVGENGPSRSQGVNGEAEGNYRDLPSEHWAEMMEVWMCHDDPTFTARLAAQTKEGFWPKNGDVLVGASYLLLGEERVNGRNITVQTGVEGEPWRLVSCLCGETLGKQRIADDKPGAGTVRFSKWAIALFTQDHEYGDDENTEPIRFPLSVFVVSDMLELSQAHASHRFVICDEESGDRRIYIWLFNPSVQISYRRPSNPSSTSPLRTSYILPAHSKPYSDRRSRSKSRRSSSATTVTQGPSTASAVSAGTKSLKAAKIMYKVVDAPNLVDFDALPGFGPGGQVEQLSYPQAICDRLISTLTESTLLYPVSRRSMGKFDIGFLERI